MVIGGAAVVDKYDSESALIWHIREVLRRGEFTTIYNAASTPLRRRLRAAVYEIVWPVVFNVLTKPLELRRGHVGCASSVRRMPPDCYDAFTDDVGAVVDWIMRHATVPVHILEAWIAGRIKTITIDAHRQRRGERGAQQRPRVPKWLIVGLGDDAWLVELAEAILTWVGVTATAGTELWPIGAWSERRAIVRGETVPSEDGTRRDVEEVLRAMRARPAWYEQYVERPLGHKHAPLSSAMHSASSEGPEPPPLELVSANERDEAALAAVAAAAVQNILERIGRGEPARAVVADVLRRAFGGTDSVDEIDRVPGTEPADAERLRHMTQDPAQLDRIVNAVITALGLG
jgi:hypothetical protein